MKKQCALRDTLTKDALVKPARLRGCEGCDGKGRAGKK